MGFWIFKLWENDYISGWVLMPQKYISGFAFGLFHDTMIHFTHLWSILLLKIFELAFFLREPSMISELFMKTQVKVTCDWNIITARKINLTNSMEGTDVIIYRHINFCSVRKVFLIRMKDVIFLMAILNKRLLEYSRYSTNQMWLWEPSPHKLLKKIIKN